MKRMEKVIHSNTKGYPQKCGRKVEEITKESSYTLIYPRYPQFRG